MAMLCLFFADHSHMRSVLWVTSLLLISSLLLAFSFLFEIRFSEAEFVKIELRSLQQEIKKRDQFLAWLQFENDDRRALKATRYPAQALRLPEEWVGQSLKEEILSADEFHSHYSQSPHWTQIIFLKADCQLKAKNWDAAFESYQQILRQAPDSDYAAYSLLKMSEVLMSMRQLEEALMFISTLKEHFSHLPEVQKTALELEEKIHSMTAMQ
jgi:outer membrane protein assembly factor BamD (BamD/ComL family)